MLNHQLYPLEVNTRTGEPFLRLNIHKNIIITPPRPTDAACYLPILNDPRVYNYLVGPKIPHLLEHAEAWLAVIKPPSDAALDELEKAKDETALITVSHCPVRAIREIVDDGDVYLGDIGITRCKDGRVLTPPGLVDNNDELGARYREKNDKRVIGDPDIVWSVGDYLAPSHHGQGIMTDALATILHHWAIPRMGVRKILATAPTHNQASIKVFQKNGFRVIRKLQNVEHMGRMHDFYVIEWDINTANVQS